MDNIISDYLINQEKYIIDNKIKPEEEQYMMPSINKSEKSMFDFIMGLIM
ncbi:MAG: hypothetical protein ACOWWH_05245 [Eubacteriaceae bacterium]